MHVGSLAAVVLAAAALSIPAPAQWLKLPTPGIPRTADGKPDLSAPAPRKADGTPSLAGMWRVNGKYLNNLAADLKPGEVPFQPWAETVFNQRKDGSRAKDDPAARCLPGMPKLNALPYPFKVFETPGVVVILYEGFTTFRQIFTDGRALPKDPQPSWMGYSVGRWEGDTLVAETIGINETTWMDNSGHPHTDALHLTERFKRRDFGRMDIQMTIDDPKAYTKPWTITEEARVIPDSELLEFVCQENEQDYRHLAK
jgi:hypothetical protein